MEHPRYDKRDKNKAGQPVLVGDDAYFESSIPNTPSRIHAKVKKIEMLGNGQFFIDFDGGHVYNASICKWFSSPPAPEIEPCECGKTPTRTSVVGNGIYVTCSCGRSGPLCNSNDVAIAAWNSDRRQQRAGTADMQSRPEAPEVVWHPMSERPTKWPVVLYGSEERRCLIVGAGTFSTYRDERLWAYLPEAAYGEAKGQP